MSQAGFGAPDKQAGPHVHELPYNHMFDTLVSRNRSSPDLEGMLAYALYKRSKQKWITSFKGRNANSEPSKDQIREYVFSLTEYDIERLKKEAREYLDQYADYIVNQVVENAKKNAIEAEIVKEVKRQQSFGPALLASLLASGIIAICLIILGGIFLSPPPQEIGKEMSRSVAE